MPLGVISRVSFGFWGDASSISCAKIIPKHRN